MVREKLLLLTTTFPQGHDDKVSARFVYDLATSLTRHYTVYVLTPYRCSDSSIPSTDQLKVIRFKYFFPLSAQLLGSGEGLLADVRRNRLAVFQLPLFFAAQFIYLLCLCRKEKIRIVNSHWIVPQGFVGAVLKKLLSCKHIVTVHAAGIFMLRRYANVGKLLGTFIGKNADALISVSKYIDGEVDAVTVETKSRRSVVPMGVNLGKFTIQKDTYTLKKRYGLKEHNPVFLFVGKFSRKKGIPILLEAFARLKEKTHSRCRPLLLLAGGGELLEAMKELAHSLALKEQVRFLGWVHNDELPFLYSLSDWVVIPSVIDRKGETEGLPVVIMEAFACGVPVIASKVSGIPEAVEDGANGFLVEPGNVQALFEVMQRATEYAHAQGFKENTRTRAARYNVEVIADQYQRIITNA